VLSRLQILDVAPTDRYFALREALVGTPLVGGAKPQFLVARQAVAISLEDKRRINKWARQQGIPRRITYRRFMFSGVIGYPSTPAELAYDEYDQLEDEPKSKPRRKRLPRSGLRATGRRKKERSSRGL